MNVGMIKLDEIEDSDGLTSIIGTEQENDLISLDISQTVNKVRRV